MLTSPLFRRLFVPYFLVICCCIAVVGVAGARQLRNTHLLDVEQRLRGDSLLIARLLGETIRAEHAQAMNAQIEELGQALACRVTIIKPDGIVVADSEADAARMENHRMRPEIVAAIASGEGVDVRKSDTVHQDMVYFARSIDNGPMPSVLRLSVHLRELDRDLALLYRRLALVALAAVLAGGAACFYFARRHSVPIVELTEFAEALSSGDLAHRLAPSPKGEIATVSSALNSMADTLAKLLSDSANDRTRLRAILAAMSEGVIATDDHHRILIANAAAARLLNFDAESAIDRPLWEILRSEELLKATRLALDEDKHQSIQIGPISGRHLEIVLSPFAASDDHRGLVIAAHDTTEAVRYEELRTQFVANVSHELRTPITAIKGYAETLLGGAIDDRERAPQFLTTIAKHADQLANLVTDLLDLARLEAQAEPYRHAPVDLTMLIQRVADTWAPAAQQKRQTLEIRAHPASLTVLGNSAYIERAISNLIENAIKYTGDGGTIAVAARADQTEAIIEVSDNGIGIPAEDLPRVFERFYRVDRSRSRAMGGTGLGLSIVKHVAQVHGGSVDIVSSLGHGSAFTLRLPRNAQS